MAREPFNRTWAEDPEQFEEPTETTWTLGWEGGAAKNPPRAAQENWWHNRLDVALQQIERNGYMDYDPDAIYQQGGRARGSDGGFYISITSPNAGNDPVTDGGVNWILDPVNDMTLEPTGHYRLPGGLLLQWIKADELAGPDASIGSRITHTLDFEIAFSAIFGAVVTGVNDTSQIEPEGSEMNAGIASESSTGVDVMFTRTSGTNAGNEIMSCFVIAVGI